MDGTKPRKIVSALNHPSGITIDFQDSRLYWTTAYSNRVQSSDMDGNDVETIVQLPKGSRPRGIGYLGGRIYWTCSETQKIQRSTESGDSLRVLHTDTDILYHMVIAPRPDLPRNRTNHCKNRSCTEVCVLTPTSSRCLS